MKLAKQVIAIFLLFSMLLTGCSMSAPQEQGEDPESQGEPVITFNAQPLVENNSTVTPTTVKTTMFNAKFEGKSVAGKGEVVDGVYRFTATQTDG